jgi:hypothetical protein
MSAIKITERAPGKHRWLYCLHSHRRYVDSEVMTDLADNGLPNNRQWLDQSPGTQVSDSVVTNCFRIDLANGGCLYFKRYNYTSYKKWRYFLRPSKAMIEAFAYRRLAKLNIESLQVLAFDEHRRWGRLVSASIVTRGIQPSEDLEHFAKHVWPGLSTLEQRHQGTQLKSLLFSQIRRGWQAGFFHQDLHWRNLLVIHSDHKPSRIAWIDSPRAKFHSLMRKHAKLIDLSTLSRVAIETLGVHARVRALAELLGERPPLTRTRQWIDRINAHHRRTEPRSLKRQQRKARTGSAD